MRRMILILMMLLLAPVSFAQTTESVAGIGPSSPLYGLDTFFDNVKVSLQSDPEKKAELLLEVIEERQAEAQIELENNRRSGFNIAEQNRALSTERLESTLTGLSEEKRELVEERLNEVLSKHVDVIQEVIAKTPDEARNGLETAVIASQSVINSIGGRR